MTTCCSLVWPYDHLTAGGAGAGDGGADAPRADAAGDEGGACAARRWALCDDFDHAELGALWATTSAVGGTLTLDTDASVSPPRSLLVTVPLPSEAAAPQAFLGQTFGAPTSALHCEIDLRVDLVDPKGAVNPLNIALTPTDPDYKNYSLFLVIDANALKFLEYMDFADGGSFEPCAQLAPPSTGQWLHYAIDVDVLSGRGTLWEGTTRLATMPLHLPRSASATTLEVGQTYVYAPGGDSTWQLRFDDVGCSVQ